MLEVCRGAAAAVTVGYNNGFVLTSHYRIFRHYPSGTVPDMAVYNRCSSSVWLKFN